MHRAEDLHGIIAKIKTLKDLFKSSRRYNLEHNNQKGSHYCVQDFNPKLCQSFGSEIVFY